MAAAISETAQTLRQRFGVWLKERREAAGVTQLELSRLLGHDYVSMVSQVERGRSLIPAPDLAAWADALKVERAEFARQYLYHCHPEAAELLTGRSVFEAEGLPPIPKGSATNPGGRKQPTATAS
jgi:transcriptional regulator with XRE-family HTH domain